MKSSVTNVKKEIRGSKFPRDDRTKRFYWRRKGKDSSIARKASKGRGGPISFGLAPTKNESEGKTESDHQLPDSEKEKSEGCQWNNLGIRGKTTPLREMGRNRNGLKEIRNADDK